MQSTNHSLIKIIIFALITTGCGSSLSQEEIDATAESFAATMIVETIAAQPTNTATPTATATLTPTPTPPPTITPTPTATETSTPELTEPAVEVGLKYWLLWENTGGPVGCGDSLAFINTGIPPSGDLIEDIRTVFNAQFKSKGEYFFGLFNPLHGSRAKIQDLYFDGSEYVIIAAGHLARGEKGCRWDQIRSVVGQAMRTIPGVDRVEIKFNGLPFNDLVSKDK